MDPLAIYIHWPFCRSKCPYCDFNSHVRDSVDQDAWRQALLIELEWMATHVPNREVTSIFFGGGTPSLMPVRTAAALIERVLTLWPVAEGIEITLEANPTSVEADTFSDFRNAGVNRVSLGVQSLDNAQLKFLGREHSATEALKAVDRARQIFDRYTFDLIYARPNQSVGNWESELQHALTHAGSHLSLYQLTIEENTAFAHAYKKGDFTMPDEETSEALYRLTEDIMNARGMPAYEVSNYAMPGEESRHNLAYWRGWEYVGIGPGAHGRLSIAFAKASCLSHEACSGPEQSADRASSIRTATATLKSPERWLSSVQEKGNGIEVWDALDGRAMQEERLMMGLRLAEGVDVAQVADIIDKNKLEQYQKQGLLIIQSNRLRTTLEGRLLLNNLIAELVA